MNHHVQSSRIGTGVRLIGVMSIATGLLVGCSPKVEEAPAAPAPQPVTAPAPVPPAVSINALMVAHVDHVAHTLWDVEREGRAPKTANDWNELEHDAIQLAAAGPMIALGGTGPLDAGWVNSPLWTKFAGELTTVAIAERDAAQKKDMNAVLAANGRLVEVCENCHKEFKPALPTEGLVHPHEK